MDYSEFFKYYGNLPVQFAQGVYISIAYPTVEELYQAFAARVKAEMPEGSKALNDFADRATSAISATNRTLGTLEHRVYTLETSGRKSKLSSKPESGVVDDVKVVVALAEQDKLELVGSVLADDQAVVQAENQESASWESTGMKTGADGAGG